MSSHAYHSYSLSICQRIEASRSPSENPWDKRVWQECVEQTVPKQQPTVMKTLGTAVMLSSVPGLDSSNRWYDWSSVPPGQPWHVGSWASGRVLLLECLENQNSSELIILFRLQKNSPRNAHQLFGGVQMFPLRWLWSRWSEIGEVFTFVITRWGLRIARLGVCAVRGSSLRVKKWQKTCHVRLVRAIFPQITQIAISML